MKYINRKNTCCSKWDGLRQQFGEDDLLSMWVADMDFRCPECVQEAIRDYMACGAYGYASLSGRFQTAFAQWERERPRPQRPAAGWMQAAAERANRAQAAVIAKRKEGKPG